MRTNECTATTEDVMDVETNSFVDVLGESVLSLSVIPKHNVIGTNVPGMSTTRICANIKTNEVQDEEEGKRAPVDIIVALDVSASMSGNKLELCKTTLNLLVRHLLPKDRFGLITYSTTSRVEIPVGYVTKSHKDMAFEIIKSLTTRSCTNIASAIGLATQEMRCIEEPNGVRAIFLLTDGLANVGISDDRGLIELTKNCLDSGHYSAYHDAYIDQKQQQPPQDPGLLGRIIGDSSSKTADGKEDGKEDAQMLVSTNVVQQNNAPPITLHTFGYGVDHNAVLLRGLAGATEGGSYYFVEDDSNVGLAFGDALGSVLSVVAQTAVITIAVPPETVGMGVQINKVFHDQAIKRQNGSYTVTVGDFYSEESRDILFEVELSQKASTASSTSNDMIPHVVVKLSYTDIRAKRLVQTGAVTCSIYRPTGSTELSAEDTHVAAQSMRIFATQEMAAAAEYAKANNFHEARARLRNVQEQLEQQSGVVRGQAFIAALPEQIREIESHMANTRAYEQRGSKVMMKHQTAQLRQRCTFDRDEASVGASSGYTMNRSRKCHSKAFSTKY